MNVSKILCVSRWSALLALFLSASGAPAVDGEPLEAEPERAAYGKVPWHFEPNRGQWDPAVRFGARGRGFGAFVTPTELVLRVEETEDDFGVMRVLADGVPRRSAVVRFQFVGAGAKGRIDGLDRLPGTVNYYVGSDPTRWRTDLPIYARVVQRDVYPGIDLVLHGANRQLEFDFVVAPGADPRSIRFRVVGADSIAVVAGDLVVHTAVGDVRLPRPAVFQHANAGRRDISARYGARAPSEFGFDIGDYDGSRPLVIDPLVVIYSTYLGGFSLNNYDWIYDLAVTPSAYAYVTGTTNSLNFPLAGTPYQSMYVGGEHDGFVTKFDPNGQLVFSTYFGGSAEDVSAAIAVDNAGVAYVGGDTVSTDFPILNAYQPMFIGVRDAWLARIGPTGALLSSTYFGEGGYINAIAVRSGSPPSPSGPSLTPLVAFTGVTSSADLPTVNPFQPSRSGSSDAFVATMDPSLAPAAQLTYSTYIGGTGQADESVDIDIDSSDRLWIVGSTQTNTFPTANAYQPMFAGVSDGFVAKIDPSAPPASQLLFSTFLGGSGFDKGLSIAVGPSDAAYVSGMTGSGDFPTMNPLQDMVAGVDAFVTVFDSSGANLLYSTFFGGSADDQGQLIAVDASANIYLAGPTASADFPQLNPMPSLNTAGSADIFLIKIGAAGALVYSTKFGGIDTDLPYGLGRDGYGDVYVAGVTASPVFPIKNAFQAVLKGALDGFVTRIREQGSDVVITVDPTSPIVTALDVSSSLYTITNKGLAAAEETELVVSSRGAEFKLLDVSPGRGRCKVQKSQRAFTCELGAVGPGERVGVRVILQPLEPKRSIEIVSTARAVHQGRELEPSDNRVVQTIAVR